MGTINDMILKLKSFGKELEDLSGKTVQILPDANGMIDRQCPKDECRSYFKVNSDDWKDLAKEEAFCPFCRNNSKAQDYLPIKHRETLISSVHESLMDNWKYGKSIPQQLLSLESTKEFALHIQCEKCSTRFSVIGAAYFCPCCGFNSVERTAISALELIISKAEKIGLIQQALEATFSKDEAAAFAQTLLEGSVADCIGILQTFSETKYNQLSTQKAPFNVFQHYEKGNNCWMSLSGHGYNNWLTRSEKRDLQLFIQRRHLFEHKGGIVDSKYLAATNDALYTEGSRLIVNAADIILLGNIILKLIRSINLL